MARAEGGDRRGGSAKEDFVRLTFSLKVREDALGMRLEAGARVHVPIAVVIRATAAPHLLFGDSETWRIA